MEIYITALSYHVPSETVHIFLDITIYVFLYITASEDVQEDTASEEAQENTASEEAQENTASEEAQILSIESLSAEQQNMLAVMDSLNMCMLENDWEYAPEDPAFLWTALFYTIGNHQKGAAIGCARIATLFYIDSWKVLEMTSACCSGVSLMKFTAYPDTRMVS